MNTSRIGYSFFFFDTSIGLKTEDWTEEEDGQDGDIGSKGYDRTEFGEN